MQTGRAEFELLMIYREGMLTTAYRAEDMARAGASPMAIARELKRQAFGGDDFGPDNPAVNDNQARHA